MPYVAPRYDGHLECHVQKNDEYGNVLSTSWKISFNGAKELADAIYSHEAKAIEQGFEIKHYICSIIGDELRRSTFFLDK